MEQWVTAVASMTGEIDEMDVANAVQVIRDTPPARRSEFSREIWRIRRQRYGPRGHTGYGPRVPF